MVSPNKITKNLGTPFARLFFPIEGVIFVIPQGKSIELSKVNGSPPSYMFRSDYIVSEVVIENPPSMRYLIGVLPVLEIVTPQTQIINLI